MSCSWAICESVLYTATARLESKSRGGAAHRRSPSFLYCLILLASLMAQIPLVDLPLATPSTTAGTSRRTSVNSREEVGESSKTELQEPVDGRKVAEGE